MNNNGQCGIGSLDIAMYPTPVRCSAWENDPVIDACAGAFHSLALTKSVCAHLSTSLISY